MCAAGFISWAFGKRRERDNRRICVAERLETLPKLSDAIVKLELLRSHKATKILDYS